MPSNANRTKMLSHRGLATMRHRAALSSQTEKRLCAYALAAAGSGIGLLAFAQPSEAQIIYTPADVTITNQRGAAYDLDVNGDGITDFVLGGGIDATTFYVHGLKGNELIGHRSAGSSVCYASAMKEGRFIGSGHPLQWCVGFPIDDLLPGFWRNERDRYLGFSFKIDSETHYGWARLGVSVDGGRITAHLTGYAYQTTPNQPIKAGQISDGEGAEPQTVQTGSLGALALGSLRSHN